MKDFVKERKEVINTQ